MSDSTMKWINNKALFFEESMTPIEERRVNLTQSGLYNLCSELQQHYFLDSLEYREAERCKNALSRGILPIAKASMPKTLCGVTLELEGI